MNWETGLDRHSQKAMRMAETLVGSGQKAWLPTPAYPTVEDPSLQLDTVLSRLLAGITPRETGPLPHHEKMGGSASSPRQPAFPHLSPLPATQSTLPRAGWPASPFPQGANTEAIAGRMDPLAAFPSAISGGHSDDLTGKWADVLPESSQSSVSSDQKGLPERTGQHQVLSSARNIPVHPLPDPAVISGIPKSVERPAFPEFHASRPNRPTQEIVGFSSLRMVSNSGDLAALLQTQVSAPEAGEAHSRDMEPRLGGGPTAMARPPAYQTPIAPVPNPLQPARLSVPTQPAREITPEFPKSRSDFPREEYFQGPAGGDTGTDIHRDGARSASEIHAEDTLVDRLFDKFQDRLREETIRRVGLTGDFP